MTRPLLRWSSVPALLLMAACHKSAAPPAATPSVEGHERELHWGAAAVPNARPVNLNDAFYEALADDGAGGFTRHEGAGTAEGTFDIPGFAPSGNYWLRQYKATSNDPDHYLLTDAAALDFDRAFVGRIGEEARSQGTKLKLSVTGMQPWDADMDLFELINANAGVFERPFFSFNSAGTMAPGDTSADLVVPRVGEVLASAEEGDRALLVQTRVLIDPATGLVYSTPVATAQIPPFTEVDGLSTYVQAALQPASGSFRINWRLSDFAALAPQVNPALAQSMPAGSFALQANPAGPHPLNPVTGTEGGFPNIYVYDDAGLFQSGKDVDATIPFGDVFPLGSLTSVYAAIYTTQVSSPDATVTMPFTGFVATAVARPPEDPTPIAPLVSPVQAPTIAGKDLFQDQRGVGLSPTIAWRAPATGTAAEYVLTLFVWDPSGAGDWNLNWLTDLTVPGDVTSVKLPPDVLQPAKHYVLILRAVSQPGLDVRHQWDSHPGLPYGPADAISADFTP